MTTQIKTYIFGVVAGLIILMFTGWPGLIVLGCAFLFWFFAFHKGQEGLRAYLFLSALDEGKSVSEANEFAALISGRGLAQVVQGAELYAKLRYNDSTRSMIDAAKRGGFNINIHRGLTTVRAYIFLSSLETGMSVDTSNALAMSCDTDMEPERMQRTIRASIEYLNERYGGRQLPMIAAARAAGFRG